MAQLTEEMQISDRGAPSPVVFAGEAQKLGRLIARDSAIKVAFVMLGGWDTHLNQGSSTGQLANRLKGLSETVSAFAEGLGSAYSDTAVI